MEYECTTCHVIGTKLWREYQVMYTDLFCVDCADIRKEYPIDPSLFDEDGTHPDSTSAENHAIVKRVTQIQATRHK